MAERVVVAMSGGVDSSVAAALLVEQGYDVIGVMLRLWAETSPPCPPLPRGEGECDAPPLLPRAGETWPPFPGREGAGGVGMAERFANRCCSVEAIGDARSVAERLGIPFYVLNVERPFKEAVVDFFVAEYAAGRTPNPCLVCNRRIRFGHLLEYARALGARYLATGHYAQVGRDAAGRYQLRRGVDPAKDQSYVLHVLGQAELAQALFPVGSYIKSQVRALAAARGLPTAARAESQDLCFVADGDYRRFLADQAPHAVQPGQIEDRTGHRLGMHRGLPFYTVGQRGGLGIGAAQPLYVLALEPERNALVVGPASELGRDRFTTGPVNWIAGAPPAAPCVADVQIRYHATPVRATVLPQDDGTAVVQLAAPLRDIAPGQAAVFYAGEVCLGGGSIAG